MKKLNKARKSIFEKQNKPEILEMQAAAKLYYSSTPFYDNVIYIVGIVSCLISALLPAKWYFSTTLIAFNIILIFLDYIIKRERNKATKWVVIIFIVTIIISSVISLASDELMSGSHVAVCFVILFAIVFLGIVFDVVGVAVTSADEKPFHSMAARKVVGSQEAIKLLRNADKVGSICNDVIGDICGVVSGSASATIAAKVLSSGVVDVSWNQVIMLSMSALAAGITVAGKAVGKNIAINSCTNIVHAVGALIYRIQHISDLFRKKK